MVSLHGGQSAEKKLGATGLVRLVAERGGLPRLGVLVVEDGLLGGQSAEKRLGSTGLVRLVAERGGGLPRLVVLVVEDGLLGDESVGAPHLLQHLGHPLLHSPQGSDVVLERHDLPLGRLHSRR